ncbi:sugar ABC transporter substrate-binding protein [Acrocarpospora phusangensis]|uniref:Sugar ABC transporter substrate-binding protein n=1 Tax=Acrocarpospora phusangensis TaxID=1070424 RepID=A0A919QE30_9ACTN|nr:extracellular solute-binding protein [Acrocarpospora phusangensis]GIH25753.1 sugar ABC transporter substrate-binding protein [Acrocarpospora phusangensis]
MRRPGLALAALLLAACSLVLAACSGTAPAGGTPGELTVWIMGDSSARFEQLVRPFVDRTGIRVDPVPVPWDSVDQKFTTAVASGDGPDALQIGLSKLRTFADSGALLTLDDRTLREHPGLAAANFLDGVSPGGDPVSVPWVADTRVLFYRRDILTGQGLDEPPRTWDEVRAYARILAGRGGGGYGFHIPQWDSALPVIMTWTMGGRIVDDAGRVDFDTPEFHRAADLYLGFHADRSVPADPDFDQIQGFVSGATPMLVSGPYLAGEVASAAPELDGKWSVAPIPGDATHTSLLAGSNLGVWRSSGNRDAALRLLDYLSQPRTQLTWYELDGQLPTAKAALNDPELTADPLVSVYARQLRDARPLPPVPNWDGETGKALLDALNSVVLTGANRDTALQGLYAATGGTSVN